MRYITTFLFFFLILSLNGQSQTEYKYLRDDSLISRHEFSYRMNMAYERLVDSKYQPVFNKDFILADVILDPANPRRFFNFSGDLSGRFFEVMASAAEKRTDYQQLMEEALKYQKADGRFGDVNLHFNADEIGGEHMALLWGNGRFLVGLMEYYKHFKDPKVLDAAKKLGDFFKQTYTACSKPEVVAKLEGFGAQGIICFTQYIEGLVMLSEETGDMTYTDFAKKTYPLIGERGAQHSHGYLTTLRGVLKLYEFTGNKTYLKFVRDAIDDLSQSDDITIYGSVKEFFGNIHDRDEGCSTADLLRLYLGLYSFTKASDYLLKAENVMYNSLYFNQYYTGDFGHHDLTAKGSAPSTMMAAWWCCTMHGLRALQVVKDQYFIKKVNNGYKLDLYIETEYKDNDISLSCSRGVSADKNFNYRVDIVFIKKGRTLSLRVPEWCDSLEVVTGDKTFIGRSGQGYLTLNGIKTGEQLKIRIVSKVRIRKDNGKFVSIDAVGNKSVNGSLFVGPHMMGVEQIIDQEFCAEPNENKLYVDRVNVMNDRFIAVEMQYTHDGFPSFLKTTLTPVSQATFLGHSYQIAKSNFLRKLK